jgi:nicotinic acid mononucleotide adenylyltransferase
MNTKQLSMAIFGGSFRPPGVHHRVIAQHLVEQFDVTCIVPCWGRKDKDNEQDSLTPELQKLLVELSFADLPVGFDHFDLFAQVFTPTHKLDKRFSAIYPDRRIVHVVGTDLVTGGKSGTSQIHGWVKGKEIWEALHFGVVVSAGTAFDFADLPPHSQVIHVPALHVRSSQIRPLLAENSPEAADYLVPEVYAQILQHQLFGAKTAAK